jgi:hypothetical protein
LRAVASRNERFNELSGDLPGRQKILYVDPSARLVLKLTGSKRGNDRALHLPVFA